MMVRDARARRVCHCCGKRMTFSSDGSIIEAFQFQSSIVVRYQKMPGRSVAAKRVFLFVNSGELTNGSIVTAVSLNILN